MSENQTLSQVNQLQGKLFFPHQVFGGTFLGGPLAGTYYIAKNYESFGDIKRKNLSIILGIFITMIFSLFFLAVNIENIGIRILFATLIAWGFNSITKKLFDDHKIPIMPKTAIAENILDKQSIIHSVWYALGVVFGGIIANLLLAYLIGFILTIMGFKIS